MATFTEEFTRMRQDFDQAQADRDQLMKDTHEFTCNMAKSVKEQLAGCRQNMRELHSSIMEAASQVRTGLAEMHTDLSSGGNVFRKSSSPRMARHRKH